MLPISVAKFWLKKPARRKVKVAVLRCARSSRRSSVATKREDIALSSLRAISDQLRMRSARRVSAPQNPTEPAIHRKTPQFQDNFVPGVRVLVIDFGVCRAQAKARTDILNRGN
eukprot:2131285-Rhodomonas_salina.2